MLHVTWLFKIVCVDLFLILILIVGIGFIVPRRLEIIITQIVTAVMTADVKCRKICRDERYT